MELRRPSRPAGRRVGHAGAEEAEVTAIYGRRRRMARFTCRARIRRPTSARDRRVCPFTSRRTRALILTSASTTTADLLGNRSVGDRQRPVTLITCTPLVKWLVVCCLSVDAGP